MNSVYQPYGAYLKFGGAWVLGADIAAGMMITNRGGLFICKPGMGHIAAAENEPIPSMVSAGTLTLIVPTGAKNGTNKTFTLPYTPTSLVMFFQNGQLLTEGVGKDFTISGVTITTLAAIGPASTDELLVLVPH